MTFSFETVVPRSRADLWAFLHDIPRIAACLPGCERIVEKVPLSLYSAVLRQKVGPFAIDVPADVVIDGIDEGHSVEARATGKDKLTRTLVTIAFRVGLEELAPESCRLKAEATLQVSGRLASLGHGVIKKKATENFAEFERRLSNEMRGV
jgi:carbon monoxide dehydrogenase subunit G